MTKVNPSGSGLVYSTYIGGTGNDQAEALPVLRPQRALVLILRRKHLDHPRRENFEKDLLEAGNPVTWTYDDGNGNTTTQTQNIVANDVTAPGSGCRVPGGCHR